MRVGFNAFFLGQPSTGSGQYSQHLLRALAGIDRHNEYIAYGPEKPHPSTLSGFSLGALSTPWGRRSTRLAKLWLEQISFPRACRRDEVNVAHVPYFGSPLYASVPTVVTIHDLIPLLLPNYRSSVWVQLYTSLVAASARRADMIITDSRHSKQDIVQHLHIASERVRTIHLAADPACKPIDDEGALVALRRKYELPDAYMLYLGGFDRRKNVGLLLHAYALLLRALPDTAPPLVVAGRLGDTHTALFPDIKRITAELGIEHSVRFTGWIAEEDKPALYSGALFFAFLSLYEGFGLEPLEAMSCGTPLLVSNCTSLPEIVGSGGLFVDATDVLSVAEGMAALVQDSALREHLAERGLAQAARFDWNQTARETLDVFHLVAQRGSPAGA
jgi:glycosyltransferase involved in cell wall biosynthesis